MKFSVFLFLFFLIFSLTNVTAEIYKQNEPITFIQVVTIGGAPSSSVYANITIADPDNVILVPFSAMTYNVTSQTFNFTLYQTLKTGTYKRCIYASSPTDNETTCFEFDVTPSGKVQTSILENPMFLVFGVISLLFIVLGVYMSNPWAGFIGSIMLLLSGVYTMIYGFNNEQNFYTQGIALTIIGVSIVFMFLSAFEWILGNEEEE